MPAESVFHGAAKEKVLLELRARDPELARVRDNWLVSLYADRIEAEDERLYQEFIDRGLEKIRAENATDKVDQIVFLALANQWLKTPRGGKPA